MLDESGNEVDQVIHVSENPTEKTNGGESVATSAHSANVQQTNVDKGNNDGQGDSNLLRTIVEALQRAVGFNPAVVSVLVV